MAQKNEQKRQLAQSLFLNTDKNLQEIAEVVGVTAKTISEWKRKYKWATLKSITVVSNHEILANLYHRALTLSADPHFSTKEMVDLKASIDFFSPDKISLDTVLTIMEEFVAFLSTHTPNLVDLKVLNQLQNDFINFKIKQYEI